MVTWIIIYSLVGIAFAGLNYGYNSAKFKNTNVKIRKKIYMLMLVYLLFWPIVLSLAIGQVIGEFVFKKESDE